MTDRRPHVLFLDLDGTLADSLPAMRAAYRAFLGELGRTGSEAEFDSLNGPALPEIVRTLRERHGLEASVDRLETRYRALITERYTGDARPAPGAQAVLSCASRHGIRVLVVTSAERLVAERFLQAHGLADSIEAVVTAEGLARSKPDPAIYRRALTLANVSAAESWAVEDSPGGWHAATGAGVRTFVLVAPGARLAIPNGAATIASLEELVPLLEGASG
jgi:HAD superfamily hydrolase (TIGR01509 family)